MQAVLASSRFGWAVRPAILVAVVVGCGSDRIAQTDSGNAGTSPVETVAATSTSAPNKTVTAAATSPVEAAVTLTPTPTASSDSYVALYECFTSHGVEDSDPALPPGQPIRVDRYPIDVATAAWDACKETYLTVLRKLMSNALGTAAELPVDAEPLAFADCMAGFGWVTPFRAFGEVTDPAGYTANNAECRRPVDGSSAAASYCRLVNAIFDTARHDQSVSITGIPGDGSDDSRLDAAVRLYDGLVEVAPAELVDDLRTLQDGFRQGSESPDDVWTRVTNYHAGVCGVFVRFGSLD
jgi:hypothetical protein